ncbi:MAG: ABC transporter ATP-binding protein [Ignavibacteriaceae bacterium]|mgnify:CR=1 FL=1|jgi:ABC-type multidrug transport system, ATPase component|nr:MAG: ABC transporter ATPase subunit [Chlorobi bacterium OLB4]MBV6399109.1 ABC transporter ATP-binding protein NatA [Ignavibacteria bacterium]MCC6885327.1 ABC transporter ATP-binding protein [Ignavibacteriales bacterium]MCE7953270.1 ABC transporter ATP-binding protein [Chlorobi bacterium CHB7]MDL1887312.1 ABC transporter ATP-binding protein [Ignavibacteria bacterium CHB1]MEB2330187.1 ABC transporter ATP-binding protein [Ignavibacteriaceae bacterium]OQY78250.1 MAG: hypothetical protein B6D43
MIVVENLSKSFGNVKALDEVSFEVQKGKIAAYIGVNGAGKSTTVNILAGITKQDSGQITMCGIEQKSNEKAIKSFVGYVPENADLFNSLTPVEIFNLIAQLREIPADIARRRYEYFAELFAFKDLLKLSIGSLSKGGRQKILITSSLIHNPDILLLDEPLNGLDVSSVMIFQNMLRELADNGKTILYCSHLLDLLEKVADTVIFIESGKIRLSTSIPDLKNLPDYENLSRLFSSLEDPSSKKVFKYDEAFV